jgi:phosphohistidine phosphatase
MKRLFLLRHAKALPAETGQDDFARRLAPVGAADSKSLGEEMKRKHFKPDLILCSPSARTQETVEGLMHAFDDARDQIQISMIDKLYDASRFDLLDVIQGTDNRFGSVLIAGHNPGIYELSVTLAVRGADHLMNKLSAGFKPGSMSVLECPCGQWNFFQPGDNTLIDFLEPQDYNAPARPTRWM